MNVRTDIVLALSAGFCLAANAQADMKPQFINPLQDGSMIISRISDNGLWGVSETASTTDGDIRPKGGTLINLTTLELKSISHGSGFSGVSDVTDDGSIVVGECEGMPAYWKSDGWHKLSIPTGFTGGRLSAVTPDGHYAVGYVMPDYDIYKAAPVFYDLTEDKSIDLKGLPVLDMTHLDQKQVAFTGISPDGRYILGSMSSSYLMPASLCSYVYDRETETYDMIGFAEDDVNPWIPDADGLFFIDYAEMSPNGRYVTGAAYMVHEMPGSEFADEYRTAYLYDVETKEFEVYDGNADADVAGFSVTDSGVVLGATPAQNPYSRCQVRCGNYYYDLGQILGQVYGIDFSIATGYDVTGKPVSISGDGMTMVMVPNTTDSYIIRLKEPLSEVASRVNLLGSYTVSPVSGTVMTSVGTVQINFDRDVEVAGDATDILLADAAGNTVRQALRASSEGHNVTIGFRTQTIPQGETYTVVIPKGMFSIAGDRNVKSDEIRISYTGRGEGPLQVTQAYPADDSAVSSIDLVSNPILITFNAPVQLKDSAILSKLSRVGEDQPFCDLYAAAAGNQIMLYPLSRQNLFDGTDYFVTIPAGTVADLSGNGENEEIRLNYHGAYVRVPNADEKYLFAEDCSSFDNFIFYEGDHLAPSSVPASWGFTADTTPWWVAHDSEESTDMAFVSHSMYTPAGQSDDWAMTPQLFIPDADCFLAFQSQSYLNGKEDRLKVYVYASDVVYNTLNADLASTIREKGELVYDEVQTPGANEETLEGDWRENTVILSDYAGKNIYIAFVNDNTNQSAVFIDNVQVVHDVKILTTIETPSRQVRQKETVIKGSLTVSSEIDTFTEAELTLRDAAGTEIDRISESGLELGHNSVYRFAFATPLPLEEGSETAYTIDIAMNDYRTSVKGSVKNLTFEPKRRIVLEEYSGSDCGNCPLGFAAVENLERNYPDNFIPVIIRTYGGDPMGSGLGAYTQYLGLDAAGAPSGRINRQPVSYPMVSVGEDYRFSGEGLINEATGAQEMVWLDYARKLLSEPVELDVNFSNTYDSAKGEISVNCSLRNAISVDRHNLNVFAVILEDNLTTNQTNYMSGVTDEDLGEWGAGGQYGRPNVRNYIISDVARGVFGTTYNGTGGLVPTSMKSGQAYDVNFTMKMSPYVSDANNCRIVVMLIDANTGTVVNANVAPLGGSTAGTGMNLTEGTSTISREGTTVTATGEGRIRMEAYTAAGSLIATAVGNGSASADLSGISGVVIVRAVAADGSVTRKFIIR